MTKQGILNTVAFQHLPQRKHGVYQRSCISYSFYISKKIVEKVWSKEKSANNAKKNPKMLKILCSKKIEKWTWIPEKLSIKRFLSGRNGFDSKNILLLRHF